MGRRPPSGRILIEILVGLLLTLGMPNLPLGRWGERLIPGAPLIGHEALWWVAVALLLLYVILVERRPLSSIGLRKIRPWDIPIAIASGILMVVAIAFIYGVVFRVLHLQMNTGAMNKVLAAPFWYRFMLVTRAAVAEEILFRGYPIERLEELIGSRLAAGTISWAAFTIAYLGGWGWPQLLVAGSGGIILTVVYLWRRNLPANIVTHWIADAAGFLLPR
jgi:uncharacterized protein